MQRDHYDGRLLVQRSVGRHGGEYFYFFCRQKQEATCRTRYVPQALVEDAVLEHYKTIKFTPEFVAAVRAAIGDAVADTEGAQRLHRMQLKKELAALEVKRDNLIDLAAEGGLTGAKVKAKLREIDVKRNRVEVHLAGIDDDLSEGALPPTLSQGRPHRCGRTQRARC